MIALGIDPEDLLVRIPRIGGFTAALLRDDGQPWPMSAQIELRFGEGADPIVWAAAVSGSEARWDRTSQDCAEVLAIRRARVTLTYTDEVEVLWAQGVFRAA